MLDQKTIDIIKSTVPVLKEHGLEPIDWQIENK